MPKITALIGMALVAAMMLTGCSAGPVVSPPQATTAEQESPEPPAPAPDETVEPAPIALDPTVEQDGDLSEAQQHGFADANDWFLRSIKSSWPDNTPSDATLLGAGELACQERAAGVPDAEVVAVEGASEEALRLNAYVVTYAVMALCPEFKRD